MTDAIELRPAVAADEVFLFDSYRSSSEARFAALDMPPAQLDGLLRMQFKTRETQYCVRYPNADFDVVIHKENLGGNFYAVRGPEDFVLVELKCYAASSV